MATYTGNTFLKFFLTVNAMQLTSSGNSETLRHSTLSLTARLLYSGTISIELKHNIVFVLLGIGKNYWTILCSVHCAVVAIDNIELYTLLQDTNRLVVCVCV